MNKKTLEDLMIEQCPKCKHDTIHWHYRAASKECLTCGTVTSLEWQEAVNKQRED